MKKKILFILVILTIIFAQTSFANDFKIQTEIGINSYIKASQNFNFKVNLESEKDFKGEIVLKVPIENQNINEVTYVKYHKNIELINGENKDINFSIGNVISRNNIRNNTVGISFDENYEVIFKDKEGRIVYRKNVFPKFEVLYESYLLGFLTDDVDGLRHMNVSILGKDGINRNLKSTNINHFSNLKQLKSIDLIVIDNFNIEKLSENQINSLKQYVKNGGNIFIGTGINDKRVIEKLLNINTSDLKEIGENNLGLSSDLKVLKIDDSNLNAINKNIIYEKEDEKGKYIITTFSLSDENFISHSNPNEFFQKTIRDNFILSFDFVDDYKNRFKLDSINDYDLKRVPVESLPNLKMIVYGFAIFILLIGPINYFVLKKIDKLELLLFTILIGSIMYVGFINIISSDSILKRDYANINTIVKYDTDSMTEDSNIALKFKSGNDTLSLGNSEVIIVDDLYNKVGEIIDIYDDDQTKKIKFNKLSNWEFNQLNINRKNSVNFKPINAVLSDDSLEFNFKNIYGYDLTEAYLYINGDLYSAGDFLINEERHIKKDLSKVSAKDLNYYDFSHRFKDKLRSTLELSKNDYIIANVSNYEIDDINIDGKSIKNDSDTVFLLPLNIKYETNKTYSLEVKDFFNVKGSGIEADEEGFWVENNIELIGDLNYKDFNVNSIEVKFDNYAKDRDYEVFVYDYEIEEYKKVLDKSITINKDENSGLIKSNLKIKVESKDHFYFMMPRVKIEGAV